MNNKGFSTLIVLILILTLSSLTVLAGTQINKKNQNINEIKNLEKTKAISVNLKEQIKDLEEKEQGLTLDKNNGIILFKQNISSSLPSFSNFKIDLNKLFFFAKQNEKDFNINYSISTLSNASYLINSKYNYQEKILGGVKKGYEITTIDLNFNGYLINFPNENLSSLVWNTGPLTIGSGINLELKTNNSLNTYTNLDPNQHQELTVSFNSGKNAKIYLDFNNLSPGSLILDTNYEFYNETGLDLINKENEINIENQLIVFNIQQNLVSISNK